MPNVVGGWPIHNAGSKRTPDRTHEDLLVGLYHSPSSGCSVFSEGGYDSRTLKLGAFKKGMVGGFSYSISQKVGPLPSSNPKPTKESPHKSCYIQVPTFGDFLKLTAKTKLKLKHEGRDPQTGKPQRTPKPWTTTLLLKAHTIALF